MFRLKFSFKFPSFPPLFSRKNPESVSKFILPSDKPTETEKEDIFHRNEKIAENISHAITSSDGQMNFLVSGSWGMGKTSILYAVQESLRKHNIKPFWFSPWKYSSADEHASGIARAFLVRMAEHLERKHEVKNLYINRKLETFRNLISQFIIWVSLIANLIIFFAILGTIIYLLSLSNWSIYVPNIVKYPINFLITEFQKIDEPDKKITIILAILGVIAIPKLGEFFSTRVTRSAEIEKETSPEQLEDTYTSLLDKTLRWPKVQRLISLWEETFEDTPLFFLGEPLTTKILYKFLLKPFLIKKFVVFVDDLDRCDSGEILEFLTGMKTFLQDNRVYFLLSADMNQIRIKLEGDEKMKNPLEYLRKIVQVVWSVPYLNKNQVESLFVKTLEACGVNSKTTISTDRLTNMCMGIQNPRKIKYYLRRLLFIANYFQDIFPDKELNDYDTTLIFKLIMITDLDHELYEACSHNLNSFQHIEKTGMITGDYHLERTIGDKLSENRDLAINVIHNIPHSDSSNLEPTTAFELVESSEGEPIKSQEFLEFASSDTGKAIGRLSEVKADFEELIKGLLGNTIQGLEQLSKYFEAKRTTPQTAQPGNLSKIINYLMTCLSVIDDYTVGEDKRFSLFLEQNVNKVLFDRLAQFSPEAYGAEVPIEILNKIVKISSFIVPASETLEKQLDDNWCTNYINVVSFIDKIGFDKETPALLHKKITEKLISFISTDTEDVISKLSAQIQNTTTQQFIFEKYKEIYNIPEHSAIQIKLFDVLLTNSDKLDPTIKNSFIEFISNKVDIKAAEKTISKFPDQWNKNIIQLITNIHSGYQADEMLALFKAIWPSKISDFKLINTNFLRKIRSIISGNPHEYQKLYCDLICPLKTKNKDLVTKIGRQKKDYLDFLTNLEPSMKTKELKTTIAKSINVLKEVRQNGRKRRK